MQAEWEMMAGNQNARMNFANNIFAFLQKHKLDGVGKYVVQ